MHILAFTFPDFLASTIRTWSRCTVGMWLCISTALRCPKTTIGNNTKRNHIVPAIRPATGNHNLMDSNNIHYYSSLYTSFCLFSTQLLCQLHPTNFRCHWINRRLLVVIWSSIHITKQEAFEKCWAHSPDVASSTVACRLRDVHDDIDNDNENAWQRGPLWPDGMGSIKITWH